MLKFYDDKWRVDSNAPSEHSLWIERGGEMWALYKDGKIGLMGSSQECFSVASVKECSPQYVWEFFQKHDLKIEEVGQ